MTNLHHPAPVPFGHTRSFKNTPLGKYYLSNNDDIEPIVSSIPRRPANGLFKNAAPAWKEVPTTGRNLSESKVVAALVHHWEQQTQICSRRSDSSAAQVRSIDLGWSSPRKGSISSVILGLYTPYPTRCSNTYLDPRSSDSFQTKSGDSVPSLFDDRSPVQSPRSETRVNIVRDRFERFEAPPFVSIDIFPAPKKYVAVVEKPEYVKQIVTESFVNASEALYPNFCLIDDEDDDEPILGKLPCEPTTEHKVPHWTKARTQIIIHFIYLH
jgi:hypothetical protein